MFVAGLFIYDAIIDTGIDIDWPPFVVGGLLVLAGLIGILAFFKNFGSITFDKTKGEWWYGEYSDINESSESTKMAENTKGLTKDIGAIQVLNEWVRVSKPLEDSNGSRRSVDDSHTSYELNLVFNDGSRKTLQDSRYFNIVASNAHEISECLDIPVWK